MNIHCLTCGNILSRKNQKFCSNPCQGLYTYKSSVSEWKQGSRVGHKGSNKNNPVICGFVRRYMLEKANFKCEECFFDKRHPLDGASILQVDHIDGDNLNTVEENLRVLCPNCHALTHTYGARNIVHKRKSGTAAR